MLDLKGIYCDYYLIFVIFCMKVRWRMITKVHEDADRV